MWYSQLDRFGCIWCILGLWIKIIVIKLEVVWEVLAYHQPFWWKPWWPDTSGHFQVSLHLHVGVTGRYLACDAGVSTRFIPKTLRGVEWGTLLLALALILNYTLKHPVKSFGTEVYNADFGSWLHVPLIPLTEPTRASPLPAETTGGFTLPCAGGLATPSSGFSCLFLPGTCSFQPARGCWRGRWGRWLPSTEPEIRGEKERKGQTGLKTAHPGLEQEARWECWWLFWVLCLHPSGARQALSSSSGLCSSPNYPWPPQASHTQTSSTSRSGPACIDQERRGRCLSMVGLRSWKEREKFWGRAQRKEKRVETYLSPGQGAWPSQGWRDVTHFKRWLCTARCPY